MPLAELSFAPHSHWEGRRLLSFTLPGKTPLGLFLTFLRAWKDLHQCCTSSSHTLNSLFSLITVLHMALGGLCDTCSACVTPVVSSGFPQDYQRLEEADSTAAKGQLEQHPTQSMTQSQEGCRQVVYLGLALGMVASHGSSTVSLFIREERLLAIHTIEIILPLNWECLWAKTSLVTRCHWFNRDQWNVSVWNTEIEARYTH